MSGLNLIAFWAGWGVMAVGALAALLGLVWLVQEACARPVWRRMNRLYDLYVQAWWLHEIRKTGRTVPTKKAVRDLLARVDKELE